VGEISAAADSLHRREVARVKAADDGGLLMALETPVTRARTTRHGLFILCRPDSVAEIVSRIARYRSKARGRPDDDLIGERTIRR